MNFNKNSVLLGTLLIKGPLTRPNLWNYVSKFNLYPGITNLKGNMNRMIEENRIKRKISSRVKGQETFEYSIVQDNKKNEISKDVLDKIKSEIDNFDNIVASTQKNE